MRLIASLLLLILSFSANALPLPITSCMLAGTCSLGSPSFGYSINGNLVLAHTLYKDGTEKTLMEYQLGTGSHIDYQQWDPYDPIPLETQGVTGSLWLELDNYIYLAGSSYQTMTIYFDQTNSTSSAPNPGQRELAIPNSSLFGDFIESYSSCCDYDYPPPPPPAPFSSTAATSPTILNGTAACLAEGCYTGELLNFVGFGYFSTGTTAQLIFDPSDTRELVYFTGEGYEGYLDYTYSLSEVPLPAAVWLFGSGLLGLIGITRKKN